MTTAGAPTVGALVDEGARRLREAGIDDPRREARMLLGHVLGQESGALFARPEAAVDADAAARFRALLARRAAREPFSHLTGRREFWGLEFEVGPDVLDPRPDTEALVQLALDQVADRGAPLRILDLGTGSGCILLALLRELPAATGVGVDRSAAALAVAARNAARLGLADRVRFVESDWAAAVDGRFDLVVSNPPYIPTAAIEGLQPEVARFEPRAALDGGPDGLDAYRALAALLPGRLAPGGAAVLEAGAGQADDVPAIIQCADVAFVAARADLGGHVRALCFARKKRVESP